MKRFLKKYFLPHVGNQFRPHFYRAASVALVVSVLAGSFFIFSIAIKRLPQSGSYAAIYVNSLISYTNDARKSVAGESSLLPNDLLTKAAQLKADDMAAKGYFSHNSPDGKTPWYWIEAAGYEYKYAGENLAVNFIDSEDVTNAWMASPGHRANILNNKFKEVGIATAVGMYKGQEATFVVEMFGTPAEKPLQKTSVIEDKTTSQVVAVSDSAVAIPSKLEAEVAGAYNDDTNALVKAATSPKSSIAHIYYYLILFFGIVTFVSAVYELRKHHKSIWFSGIVLVFIAVVLWLLTEGLGQGLIQ